MALRCPSVTAPVVRAPETDDEWRECIRVAARGFNSALDDMPMGGFSPVVVAPEHRGHGYGSVVTSAHLPLLRERGAVIAGPAPSIMDFS